MIHEGWEISLTQPIPGGLILSYRYPWGSLIQSQCSALRKKWLWHALAQHRGHSTSTLPKPAPLPPNPTPLPTSGLVSEARGVEVSCPEGCISGQKQTGTSGVAGRPCHHSLSSHWFWAVGHQASKKSFTGSKWLCLPPQFQMASLDMKDTQ